MQDLKFSAEEREWQAFIAAAQDPTISQAQLLERMQALLQVRNRYALEAARLAGEAASPSRPTVWETAEHGNLVTGITSEAESFGLYRQGSRDEVTHGESEAGRRISDALRATRAR